MNLPFDSEHDVGIRLDTPTACQAELQRCSNGMAELTQQYTRNAEELTEVKDLYAHTEAILAKQIRNDASAKLTAAEVNGRILDLIAPDPVFSAIRERLLELESERDSLERRLRTLEKRGGHAQSALNKHNEEARVAGYGGQG